MRANRRTWSELVAATLLLSVILACSIGGGDETAKANKLVTEGNADIREARKVLADAEDKKSAMLRTNVSRLAEARALAKDAIRLYDESQAKAKEGAAKYEEASKLKINDKFREYLTLKTKEYDKRIELVEALKLTPQSLIDGDSQASFAIKTKAANQKVEVLKKEADDLSAEAEKLYKDNPDSFKNTNRS
jgi:hypothetical protein